MHSDSKLKEMLSPTKSIVTSASGGPFMQGFRWSALNAGC